MRADDPGRSIRVLLGKEDPLPVSVGLVVRPHILDKSEIN